MNNTDQYFGVLPKWHRNIGTVRLSLSVQIISPLQLLENARLGAGENVVSAKAGHPEPPDVFFLSVVCFAPVLLTSYIRLDATMAPACLEGFSIKAHLQFLVRTTAPNLLSPWILPFKTRKRGRQQEVCVYRVIATSFPLFSNIVFPPKLSQLAMTLPQRCGFSLSHMRTSMTLLWSNVGRMTWTESSFMCVFISWLAFASPFTFENRFVDGCIFCDGRCISYRKLQIPQARSHRRVLHASSTSYSGTRGDLQWRPSDRSDP